MLLSGTRVKRHEAKGAFKLSSEFSPVRHTHCWTKIIISGRISDNNGETIEQPSAFQGIAQPHTSTRRLGQTAEGTDKCMNMHLLDAVARTRGTHDTRHTQGSHEAHNTSVTHAPHVTK